MLRSFWGVGIVWGKQWIEIFIWKGSLKEAGPKIEFSRHRKKGGEKEVAPERSAVVPVWCNPGH